MVAAHRGSSGEFPAGKHEQVPALLVAVGTAVCRRGIVKLQPLGDPSGLSAYVLEGLSQTNTVTKVDHLLCLKKIILWHSSSRRKEGDDFVIRNDDFTSAQRAVVKRSHFSHQIVALSGTEGPSLLGFAVGGTDGNRHWLHLLTTKI